MPEPSHHTPNLLRVVPAVPTVSALHVSVRALCEFSAKAGDLDLRFTPSPTAQEGVEGHRLLGARRPPPYETELPLQGQHGPLLVRGRADGFDPVALRVDEFKTHRGDLGRQPANHRALHWAQAHSYGHLLCETRGLPALTVALVYLDLTSGQETVFTEHHTAASLQQRFDVLCQRMLQWAVQESTHRQARNAALQVLAFPHDHFRTGQRALAEAVYRAAVQGRCLLAQAPTGIGKTVGTLFPLLKAVPGQGVDKVFFLTAKTPGRQLALDGLHTLGAHHHQRTGASLPLRVLELVARDTACEHPDKACHGDACPLARGFYDRLPAARQAAITQGVHGRAALRQVALAHTLCPYYLGQELARWADVVVGDYNHYFDLHALLHGLTQAHNWRVALLVDEAHNLVPRARLMASASLDLADLRALRRSAGPGLRRPLDTLHTAWNSWQKIPLAQYDIETDAMQSGAKEVFVPLEQLPEALLAAMQRCVGALTELSANDPLLLDAQGTQWLFELLHFLTVADGFDHRYMADVAVCSAPPAGRLRTRQSTRISVRNVVPAAILQARWAAVHTATLFSATLAPPDFQRDMLGLPPATPWVDVASPFQATQLQVQVAGHISTRFAQRAASVAPIVALMARQWRARPGNYLAFFSSFDYLDTVAEAFARQCPDVPLRCQTRRMPETDRQAFVAQFTPTSQGVAFAVLGGALGEGIDLPGERLVGAFVVTLGLPQVNPVNEAFRQRLQQLFPGRGYDYTYLYPGMHKVVQAAGRVIRTPEDQGVVVLMDARFTRPAVQALLPHWWALQPALERATPG